MFYKKIKKIGKKLKYLLHKDNSYDILVTRNESAYIKAYNTDL